jgi:hypothetical protein
MTPEIAARVIRDHGHRAHVERDGRVQAWCLATLPSGAWYEDLTTFRPDRSGQISVAAIRDWLGY